VRYTVGVTAAPKKGQATLSLVLMIGGIASAVVIGIALVSVSMIGSGFGADAQQRARTAAMAGIEDGALRFARNPGDSATYTLTTGSTEADVVLYPNTPSAGFSAVYSEAAAGFRTVRLYAVYSIDPETQVTTLVSLETQ
jgi:hypothetical protein